MTTPPFLLAAGLLFWGLQTGQTAVAAVVALLLEGSRLLRARWELSDEDFHRVADACSLVFGFAAIYTYATRPASEAVSVIFPRLPLFYLPLAAAQAVHPRPDVPLGAFFMTLRRHRSHPWSGRRVDISYPFLVSCVLAASMANVRTPAFYAGLVLVSAWAALSRPAARRAPLAAAAILLAAAGLGWKGQEGLYRLQGFLESAVTEFFLGHRAFEALRSRTGLGRIGKLKLSTRVVARVQPERGSPPDRLLGAVYNLYAAPDWLAVPVTASPLPAGEEPGSWRLREGPASSSLRLAQPLAEADVLALPDSSASLERLEAAQVARGALGTVSVEGGPGYAEVLVRYGGPSDFAPPDKADFSLRPGEARLFKALARRLGLRAERPAEAPGLAHRFFADFSYSLNQPDLKGRDPLQDFLFVRRAGHCEFFATATVLLLRGAGIPSRYATGFALLERDPDTGAFLVRARHAHAWALAWDGRAWRVLDTTPSRWAREEAEGAPFWEGLRDRWDRLRFAWLRWLWRPRGPAPAPVWAALIALCAAAWLIRRLTPRRARDARKGTTMTLPGLDSEFYRIAQALEARAPRAPGETLAAWAARAGASPEDPAAFRLLERALALHYRHRFDPAGLAGGDRRELRDLSGAWLARRVGPPPDSGKKSC